MLERFSRFVALASALVGGSTSLLWASPASASDEERPLPDYDGREPPPTTVGDVLLWVPRVLLFPVYVVTEYVIRAPLGFLIAGAERHGVPAWLYDFFTFGSEHQAGVVPTVYADFDFYPSIGLYGFWDDAFVPNHDLRFRAALGGGDWLVASISDRYHFGPEKRDRLAIEATGVRRPDFTYFGIGPDTRQSALTRYGASVLEARAMVDAKPWRESTLHAQLTLRQTRFFEGGYDDDPTLVESVASGELPLPPGYVEGYSVALGQVSASFDTRRLRPEPGSGVRVAGDAVTGTLLGDGGGFVRYGGTLGGFWDVNDRRRVLSLAVGARFVEPVGGVTIPFTELVTLGGPEPMRGLYPGRLYDRSAIVGGLAYRWPIWIWLDGSMRMEFGNVFGEHLEGFRFERLRWSGSLGVESNGAPDTAFQFLLGAGSETFESGAKIDSFRFAVGATHGF
jgi:surface antigen Omp85-like protein